LAGRSTAPLGLLWLAIAATAPATSGCIYSRIIFHGVPGLSSPANFEAHQIGPSPAPAPIARAGGELAVPLTPAEQARYRTFEGLLEQNDTGAFLVIKDDVLVYERYFHGLGPSTRLPSFSMSKAFAALMVGCAIEDGLFASVDDPIARYVPELGGREGWREIKIDHLLRMTSGIDFEDESMAGAVFYYSKDLRSRIYSYGLRARPGSRYAYGSVNIQILWDALQRRLALRGTNVARYFQDRVWARLGAVDEAAWALDSAENGVEKLFGGFSATARDHARIGLLFLHGGSLNGQDVVSRSWIDASLEPDPVPGTLETTDGRVRHGKYQWFLTRNGRAFFAKGFRGQYVFVVPDRRTVFVRFAEGYGDVNWPELMIRIADAADGVR
jgi:CubicO group peptidase (beta-lactamase class C family)